MAGGEYVSAVQRAPLLYFEPYKSTRVAVLPTVATVRQLAIFVYVIPKVAVQEGLYLLFTNRSTLRGGATRSLDPAACDAQLVRHIRDASWGKANNIRSTLQRRYLHVIFAAELI